MHTVLACLTFLLLSRSVAASDLSTWARGPSGGGGQTDVAACTVEQLLPVQAPDGDWTEGGWSTNTDEARPVYDCSCPYYKARYFCPKKTPEDSRLFWQPPSVASGQCKTVPIVDLQRNFLPDGYTVLVFTNSHGREMVESLLCQFSDQVVSRNVTTSETPGNYMSHQQHLIDLDEQCRGMSTFGRKELVENACIDPTEDRTFKCKDDRSSFYFRNGASIHYRFSDMPDKDIDREMANFGLTPEGVDVILANLGNNVVRLPRWKLQNTAKRVSKSGTLVLWLTMFGGDGYYHQKKEQKELAAAGVTQVNLGTMGTAECAQSWRTMAGTENRYTSDRHFCMPGPADEMALLVVQMVWAHHLVQASTP